MVLRGMKNSRVLVSAAGYAIVGLLIISGCRQKPDFPDFDQQAWKEDVRSCQNIRPALLPAFEKIKHQLAGLSHTQIIAVLGRPEGESLESSGQRVYYYFTEPGVHCKTNSTASSSSAAGKVAIRFDALDRVNEVIFLNP